jgi:hypothetical protein
MPSTDAVNQRGSHDPSDRYEDYFVGLIGDFRVEDAAGNEIDLLF